MKTAALSREDFRIFREFFYKKTGIEFDENKRYFVDKRLLGRMQATGATSFREYFVKLRFEASGAEFQKLVNLMTVNETYFLREDHQFDCLIGPVLSEVVENRKRRKGPIRILSLPCSTGEEPYSIAIKLLEDWPGIHQHDVELAGCDIDTDVLDRARHGTYGSRSVSRLSDHLKRRYFSGDDLERYRIKSEVRDAVSLFQMNLSDPDDARSLRNYDVIFCRNLLIYFDDKSRRCAAEVLFDALSPGGFLFLGHSESMSRMCALFGVRKFPQGIVYQRTTT